jgi:hypothetical protein
MDDLDQGYKNRLVAKIISAVVDPAGFRQNSDEISFCRLDPIWTIIGD